jgi:DNA polymerase-3 subunit delta'
MDAILLQPIVQIGLNHFKASQAHALLISGPAGAGKGFIASRFVADLLGIKPEKLPSNPAYLHINANGGAIGIETIRELQHFIQLRTIGKGKIRRAIIIENAETMTTEAQNALLKLLEEPPLDTVIIMTENGEKRLKPTIYSRLQRIALTPPPKAMVLKHFLKQGFSQDEIQRTYYLANGQIGLMSNLLQSDKEDILTEQVAVAKQIFSSSLYERLIMIDSLSQKKDGLESLLYALKQVARAMLIQNIEKHDTKAITAWSKRFKNIYNAEASLSKNPNTKLLLSNLLINL